METAVDGRLPTTRLIVLRARVSTAPPGSGRQPTHPTHRTWRVTTDRAVALRAVKASERAGDAAIPIAADDPWQQDLAAIRQAIRRWARLRRARRLAGSRWAPPAQRDAWHAIDTTWDALSRFERVRLATALGAARRCVEAARGIGAEAALRAWCDERPRRAPADWLRRWPEHPALDAAVRTWPDPPPADAPARWRWQAALLLGPD